MVKLRAPWSTPRKKPKKWAPRLSRGFSPDLLQGINAAVVKAAEGLEQAIIRAVARESTRPKVNRGGFLSRLRSIVGFGLGDVAKQAFRMGVDAEAVGKATARKHAEAKTPGGVDKWGGRKPPAPKAPRNVDLGVTIRTPAALRDSFKELAPTLIGSGSELFDEVVEAIAANPPESEAARRRVAQGVLDKFGKRGITGFVDKAGRRWNIVSYVEMATRTAAGNLAMGAHLAELQAAGFDVVRVTVMPNCHPYCQPFQGRLLSITGRTLRYNGEPVVTSIADAISRGFRHPNCRHTVYVWKPGDPFTPPDQIEPGDYEASQELRRFEREVRAGKRKLAAAVTPEAQAKARREIRDAQARIRAHVAETGVPRNRYREQVGVAL